MKTDKFERIFGKRRCSVIGMIHVHALPGTPRHAAAGGFGALVEHALAEAELYKGCGIHALMLENMHDVPYVQGPGPEVTASMAVLVREVRRACPGMPIGVQVLAGGNEAALAVALAGGADFVRAEGFVFGHVADEGWMDACAGRLLRYRRAIGAEGVAVFTDIKKKHSAHAATADVDIAQTAKAAEYFLSDGVIVTGAATGESASLEELRAVRAAVGIPVMVGSGITADNAAEYAGLADALIVGSWFKEGGDWKNPLDAGRIRQVLAAVEGVGA